MPVYSHSGLSSFESCPRQFWYRYIGKPEVTEAETVEAFLGSRVHETLEELYRLRLGGRVLAERETLAWYDAAWERQWSDGVRILSRRYSADDYRRVGREALAAYHRRHRPFDVPRTLRVEAKVTVDLDGSGRYRMRGFVDRVARRDDGTYEVHDYKTSGHLPTQADADADRQLALYQIGLAGLWPDVERVDLVWHYLRFDTDLVSRRTPAQLDELRAACIETIADIEARGRDEGAFPTCPSRLCDWCEYNAICPATRHEVATRELPPAEFKADDGVALVDAWVEARERRRELERQAAELREAEAELQQRVEAFAASQGLEVVAGSTHSAAIREVVEIGYPHTGDEARAAFEAALKAAGVWDDVALLNHQRLVSLLADPGTLPEPVAAALAPFVERAESLRASLRKKRREE